MYNMCFITLLIIQHVLITFVIIRVALQE